MRHSTFGILIGIMVCSILPLRASANSIDDGTDTPGLQPERFGLPSICYENEIEDPFPDGIVLPLSSNERAELEQLRQKGAQCKDEPSGEYISENERQFSKVKNAKVLSGMSELRRKFSDVPVFAVGKNGNLKQITAFVWRTDEDNVFDAVESILTDIGPELFTAAGMEADEIARIEYYTNSLPDGTRGELAVIHRTYDALEVIGDYIRLSFRSNESKSLDLVMVEASCSSNLESLPPIEFALDTGVVWKKLWEYGSVGEISNVILATSNGPHVAYKAAVLQWDGTLPKDEIYYIDAFDGRILDRESLTSLTTNGTILFRFSNPGDDFPQKDSSGANVPHGKNLKGLPLSSVCDFYHSHVINIDNQANPVTIYDSHPEYGNGCEITNWNGWVDKGTDDTNVSVDNNAACGHSSVCYSQSGYATETVDNNTLNRVTHFYSYLNLAEGTPKIPWTDPTWDYVLGYRGRRTEVFGLLTIAGNFWYNIMSSPLPSGETQPEPVSYTYTAVNPATGEPTGGVTQMGADPRADSDLDKINVQAYEGDQLANCTSLGDICSDHLGNAMTFLHEIAWFRRIPFHEYGHVISSRLRTILGTTDKPDDCYETVFDEAFADFSASAISGTEAANANQRFVSANRLFPENDLDSDRDLSLGIYNQPLHAFDRFDLNRSSGAI